MAASNFMLGKASGGILSVSPADGTTNTSLVLPASGTVVATDVAVTDNAIARYDGTTGKVQNSGVIINDSNVIGVGTSIYTSNSLLNLKGTGLVLKNDKNGNSNNWSHITNEATGDTSSITLSSGAGSLILDHSGNLLLQSGTGGLGYGTGAGGTVTQLTSKSTAVTLNKPSGTIIMNNAALAAGSSISFTLNNNLINQQCSFGFTPNGNSNYSVTPIYSSTGYVVINVKNNSGSSLSEALQFSFTIIKGATA